MQKAIDLRGGHFKKAVDGCNGFADKFWALNDFGWCKCGGQVFILNYADIPKQNKQTQGVKRDGLLDLPQRLTI